jgi:rhodanese-related sulfurtransferase
VKRDLALFERLAPRDVMALLAQRPDDVVLVDVRMAPLGSRIPGAKHLDLGALNDAALAGWPATAELITYCACPDDASAVKAARWLKQHGRRVRVLRGGIEAWEEAGLRLEAA